MGSIGSMASIHRWRSTSEKRHELEHSVMLDKTIKQDL